MADLASLKIGQPAHRALANNGVRSLAQLSALRRSEVAAWHGIGPKALRLLDAALAEANLTWSEE